MKSLHQDVAILPVLANELNEQLAGSLFVDAWSISSKGQLREMKLIFEKAGAPVFFTFHTAFRCGLFFPEEDPLEKPGGVIPVFKSLQGTRVKRVIGSNRDRSFVIELENDNELAFLLYGPQSNALIFHGGIVMECYRTGILSHQKMDRMSLNREGDLYPVLPGPFLVVQKRQNEEPVLVHGFSENESVFKSGKILEALRFFSHLFLRTCQFTETKRLALQKVRLELKRQKASEEALRDYLRNVETGRTPGEIANILMANLDKVKKGMKEVELHDFYLDQPILIQLRKDVSPQDNAGRYYQKERNRKGEREKKENQLIHVENRIRELEQLLDKLELAENRNQIQSLAGNNQPDKKEKSGEPFRTFNKEGFKILVGKNASNNDQLTQKEAHKNDLWLHARGVSGSHVVIKHKPGLPFPEPVIRYAASLAAYYSISRGSGLVPVVYAFKKFVRKPKGSEPGQVVVDREEVMLVEPWIPEK